MRHPSGNAAVTTPGDPPARTPKRSAVCLGSAVATALLILAALVGVGAKHRLEPSRGAVHAEETCPLSTHR
jgi:hypothetical protein